MKYIEKKTEPAELIDYKKTPGVCYEDMASRPAVRTPVKQSLLEEQGFICCYCGQRIANDSNTNIEHLKSRKNYPHLDLSYENMLASCDGGSGKRSERDSSGKRINKKYPEFCDAHKKEFDIPVHPLQLDCAHHFVFDSDGQIIYDEEDQSAEETVRRLNLDNAVLNNMRREAIAKYTHETHTEEEWVDIASKVMLPDEAGQLKPFCFAVYSYIQNFKVCVFSVEEQVAGIL